MVRTKGQDPKKFGNRQRRAARQKKVLHATLACLKNLKALGGSGQKTARRAGQSRALHDLKIEMNFWCVRDRRWNV
jgi:hypothetical protein